MADKPYDVVPLSKYRGKQPMHSHGEDIVRLNRRALLAGSSLISVVGATLASAGHAAAAENPAAAHDVSPEVRKEMATWVYSLALQAATYAAPIVAMYLLRDSISTGTGAKAAAGQIWKMADISTPTFAEESGYVTPNINVVYGFGFMDLGRQPIILTAPDSHGRYYMIEICDMWTNAFAYPAGAVAGYSGGKFALVGPGWNGTLPAGVQRIDCPTRWIELQPRVHVRNEADLAAAKAVLDGVTVQGLAQYTSDRAPQAVAYDYAAPRINLKVASSQMQFEDPLQFWEIFSAAMNENPPPADEIAAVVPQFKYLGIELGKAWTRSDVNPLALEQMKVASGQIGKMMNDSLSLGAGLVHGWAIPPSNVGMSGTDYFVRAVVAVFGLTANTPIEAIYYSGLMDGNGQPLTGARRYTITFTRPMDYLEPVSPGFWSVTMYDGVTRFTAPNAINRYSLGSDDNLKRAADGSFTLYVQRDNPGADRQANWLPTPSGPFYLVLRNYAPVPQVAAALKNRATFQGPPPVIAVG